MLLCTLTVTDVKSTVHLHLISFMQVVHLINSGRDLCIGASVQRSEQSLDVNEESAQSLSLTLLLYGKASHLGVNLHNTTGAPGKALMLPGVPFVLCRLTPRCDAFLH